MKSTVLIVRTILAVLCLPASSLLVLAQQAAPAPAPPAVNAPITSIDTPAVGELQKVEDKWADALNQRDQYGLELVLSPLFINVAANGDITTRNQQIVTLINQEDKNAATDLRVITVRMLGDVAVANGTYSYRHKVNGNEVVDKGVFTHVFERQHGNWYCLNAQRTALRQDSPNKAKAKKKGKSEAELPFHIPLFSKGDKSTGPSDTPKQ
jgi:ketosteroid isomerase-like protein